MQATYPLKTEAELPAHMERVRARWELIGGEDGPEHSSLAPQVEYAAAHIDPRKREALVSAAQRAKSTAAKVQWLREDANHVSAAAAPVSACRRGCSHCCNIGVTVSLAEAEVIGAAIGRKVARPPADRVLSHTDLLASPDRVKAEAMLRKQSAWVRDAYHGTPCTFLNRHGSCTIYNDRPLICRWHINMDIDSLLCELVPVDAEPIKVPYLNLSNMHAVYAETFGTSPVADIRDWFPRSTK